MGANANATDDVVSLRLMTEHDIHMLHDWLNRPHIVEWWGGERPTTAQVDPGVRGIDQSLSEASDLGKGLGTRLVRTLVDLLFHDPAVTRIQTGPAPWQPSGNSLLREGRLSEGWNHRYTRRSSDLHAARTTVI